MENSITAGSTVSFTLLDNVERTGVVSDIEDIDGEGLQLEVQYTENGRSFVAYVLARETRII